MKIASWNINSINARLPILLNWLKAATPDLVLLQEIKCVEEAFPFLELQAAGYHALALGQKSYNGVAILSRQKAQEIRRGLPGDDGDEHARYLEAQVGPLRVASIYLPNGNPTETGLGPKFQYKLAWMDRLARHAKALLVENDFILLGGDYNVIPEPQDVYDPEGWSDDALFRPQSRAEFRRLIHLGYTDAFRLLHPTVKNAFTFWDYQAGAWPKNEGLRIDHLLLSPEATDRLMTCEIDKGLRALPKASDHTPIWCEINI